MIRSCLRVLLAGVQCLTIVSLAFAQPAVPTDGRTCFCLQHQATGQVLRGCFGSKAPADFFATASCWDSERPAEMAPITVDRGWTLVPADQGVCSPCDRRPHRDTPWVLRGD
jgi:hypothetical protein